ncbi:MAG: sterol desaturase family protein [Lewinellaceae bacterium]|nr:sterol desaturase family protein [Saprospiraceae bacterium]MCB9331030.1 sterol desaturase family protein [Lewinellaceae bacterium]
MEALREQWLILISTPIYVFVIGLELLTSHWRQAKSYTWRDTLTNLYLMLLNSGIDLLFRGAYVLIFEWCFQRRFLDWGSPWAYWLVLVVSMDFLFYWLHRVDHHCRFFWAVHVTHHSSEQFNLTVGFRSSVFQPLYRFIYFLPLAFAGFKPFDIVFVFSVTQIWGIMVHTEHVGKLGWLEYVLVTPSHHRVHHASNPLYLDRNLGMLLIIWDKWFGTFQPELAPAEYQPIRFGLTTPTRLASPVLVVLHEWRAIFKDWQQHKPWPARWSYLFGPPGWSIDGRTKTSAELRQAEFEEQNKLS